jgi:alkylated DNA nucleotide flippase Atl1
LRPGKKLSFQMVGAEEKGAFAMNLVSLIMKFLTPDMIGRIASALGLNQTDTSSAIGTAVPALLAALTGVATQPGGPQKLADAAKQEVGTLDKFASMLGTSGQTSVVQRGSQMLASLLGNRDQSALANAVGKYSGVGSAAGGPLLGALAPVVMGTIARQQGVLNAGNIASLFASQKDNIAAALPSGFVKSLGDVDLLGGVGDTARRMAAAGGETTRAAAASVARTLDDTRRSAPTVPSTNWLLWAIPALAIAALLLWLLARPTEQVAQQGVTTAQSLLVGGIDLGKQATDSLNSLRTTLTGVTDATSAQAALPKLREATAQIDKVSGMLGQMSDTQRKVLAGLVSPMMSTLNQLFDRVLAIPGVAEVIKPTIDTLKAKLATLTA